MGGCDGIDSWCCVVTRARSERVETLYTVPSVTTIPGLPALHKMSRLKSVFLLLGCLLAGIAPVSAAVYITTVSFENLNCSGNARSGSFQSNE
jgi:hypothetical protein